MSTADIPFAAYADDEPFVFISYSHRDSANVFPIIKRLHDTGHRVWYDQGIDPGSEWPEYIAEKLNAAALVICFLSRNAIGSANVRREIHFALDRQKPFISVYLEDFEMSLGLQLQLGSLQAVFLHRYANPDEFHARLAKVLEPIIETAPPQSPAGRLGVATNASSTSPQLHAEDERALFAEANAALRDKSLERVLELVERTQASGEEISAQRRANWSSLKAQALYGLSRFEECAEARKEEADWLERCDPADKVRITKIRFAQAWALHRSGHAEAVASLATGVIDSGSVAGIALADWLELRANSLLRQNKHLEALSDRERVVQLREQYGADDATKLSASRVALAWALFKCGDYDRSLTVSQLSHNERVSRLGADHRGTLSSLHLMIYNLNALKRYSEALPLPEELLTRWKKVDGVTENELADAKNWLSSIQSKVGG